MSGTALVALAAYFCRQWPLGCGILGLFILEP